MTAPILSVSDLRVSYGAIEALRGVSLEVQAGEVVALIGANGAGKTTTLRAISGMLRPSAGTVRLEGTDVTALQAHRLVARGMAHAPEGRGIFLNLTVVENLDLGAYLRRDAAGIAADRERAFALFPILAERRGQVAGTLSGGEQQMLAVARALMSRPRLLAIDEPSLGLAPRIREELFAAIGRIHAEGVPVLLVEQEVGQVFRMARRNYVLSQGRIIAEGTAQSLMADETLRAGYLGL